MCKLSFLRAQQQGDGNSEGSRTVLGQVRVLILFLNGEIIPFSSLPLSSSLSTSLWLMVHLAIMAIGSAA